MKYLLIYDNTNWFFDDIEVAKNEHQLHGGILLVEISENVFESVNLEP